MTHFNRQFGDVILSSAVGSSCALLYFMATRVLNSRVKLNPWLAPAVGGATAIASYAGLQHIRAAVSPVFVASRGPASSGGLPTSGPDQRTSTSSSVESSSSESSESGSASTQTGKEKEAKWASSASVRFQQERRHEAFPEEVDRYVSEIDLRLSVTPNFCQHCKLSSHALELLPQILLGNNQMLECASAIVKREDVNPNKARAFVDALPLHKQHSHSDWISWLICELNDCDLRTLDELVWERAANWIKSELRAPESEVGKECSSKLLEKLFDNDPALVNLLDLSWSRVRRELCGSFYPAPFSLLRAKHSIQSNPMLLPVFNDVIDDSAALVERFGRLEDFRKSGDPSKWREIGVKNFNDYINYLCVTEKTPRLQTLLDLLRSGDAPLMLAWCQFICEKLSNMELITCRLQWDMPAVAHRSLIDRLRIVVQSLFQTPDVEPSPWEEQSSSLLQLPAELLAMILEYSNYKDLANLSQVSRQLRCFTAERRISLRDLERMRLERLFYRDEIREGKLLVHEAMLLAMPQEQLAAYAQSNEDLRPSIQFYLDHLSGTELTRDRIQELLGAPFPTRAVLVRLCRDDAERHAQAMAQGDGAAEPTVLQAVLSYLLDPDTTLANPLILWDIGLYALLPESLDSISTCLSRLGATDREVSEEQLEIIRDRLFTLLSSMKGWVEFEAIENLEIPPDVVPNFRESMRAWKRL